MSNSPANLITILKQHSASNSTKNLTFLLKVIRNYKCDQRNFLDLTTHNAVEVINKVQHAGESNSIYSIQHGNEHSNKRFLISSIIIPSVVAIAIALVSVSVIIPTYVKLFS